MRRLIGKVKTSMRAEERSPRSEDGDTLIEVLLAIVILGLASVALLMAFGTSISASAEHRSLTTFDTVLRTASEEAISQIQNQQPNSLFGTCPALNATPPAPTLDPVSFTLPTGWTAQRHISAVLERHRSNSRIHWHLRGQLSHLPCREFSPNWSRSPSHLHPASSALLLALW